MFFLFINASENFVCKELRMESNGICQNLCREMNTKSPLHSSIILTHWILAVSVHCILIHWSNTWVEICQTRQWFNYMSTQGAYQSAKLFRTEYQSLTLQTFFLG